MAPDRAALLATLRLALDALDHEASRLQRMRALCREARTKLNCGWAADVVLAELRAAGVEPTLLLLETDAVPHAGQDD